MEKYIHDESVHNSTAPKQLVPILVELFHPISVVDIGCGIGTFLHEFIEHNITDVLGIDSEWVDKALLTKYLSKDLFVEADLGKKLVLNRRFDLAICLEVAEHIDQEKVGTFIDTVTSLSDVVVFSAAIPGQGGQNHVNEQWLSYWESCFKIHDYVMYDIIRPLIWDNPNIFFWYKQNMVVFAKKGCIINSLQKESCCPIHNLVHPELYLQHFNSLSKYQSDNARLEYQLNRVLSGSYPIKAYLRLLIRYVNVRFLKLVKRNK